MQIHDLDDFLERYVENYMLADLVNVKDKVASDEAGNGAYLITAAVCSGMELIGSLTTTYDTLSGCEVCGKPEQKRFKFPIDHYCAHYMAEVDKRYAPFGPIARELIRNGIAHSFATKGMIGITRKGDVSNHLTRVSDEGVLVINADCFLEDFKKSYYEFAKPDIKDGGAMRARAVENYAQMQKIKEVEIERTMKAVEGKLDSWPQRDVEVRYSPLLVD